MNGTSPADPRFEAWLARETGIDASTLGTHALTRAVHERARATETQATAAHPSSTGNGDATPVPAPALDAYWERLLASPDEKLALIETLVVPETWFFRDREAFAALARVAAERLWREPARVLRVLSAPCSSGEEPYSIAMALLDAGIAPERFTIDAIDISQRAIELARAAVYRRNAFRGQALEFRERHFSANGDGWQPSERVRNAVRFARLSLFDASPASDARYDFIFCRNLLIYFGRDAQDQAILRLDAQLAPGGMIFVGPAETGLMMRHPMASARIPLAFAFHRAEPDEAAARTAGSWTAAPQRAQPVPPHAAVVPRPVRVSVAAGTAVTAVTPRASAARAPLAAPSATLARPPSPVQAQAPAAATLDDAQRCADAGRLDEADALARTFVSRHGPHADAFYLLGLIADARGLTADARDSYRKALYLEPAHYEALTHLAALLDVIGDGAGAQQLMRRAARASAAHADPANHERGRDDA
jgi:chemotaxis protein methyltransferase WspC